MGRHSKIEWCTASWNPWYGCHKVSPACDNCYAETWAKRTGRDFGQVTRSKTTFKDPLKWKERERIFVCSLSDFLHPAADRWRPAALGNMLQAPRHIYMILTKRPERWDVAIEQDFGLSRCPPNWWVGVTAENQEQADKRIPQLFDIPAQVRFVSCEPLLGPIQLSGPWVDYLAGWGTEPVHVCSTEEECSQRCPEPQQYQTPQLDWVIVGGESGPNRREPDPKWVFDIRDQCVKAGVPFFFKQWVGHKWNPMDRMVLGREWNEMPGPGYVQGKIKDRAVTNRQTTAEAAAGYFINTYNYKRSTTRLDPQRRRPRKGS